MPMEQNEYEKKLKGLVKWIKTNEPASNPSEKKSQSEDGMVVVVRVLPQGPCADCGRRCKNQRFCSHRRDRNNVWQSHCHECGLPRNPVTGRYEPKPVADSTAKKKAKEKAREIERLKKMLAREDAINQKTSERTKILLQRLAEISSQSVLTTNDRSDD